MTASMYEALHHLPPQNSAVGVVGAVPLPLPVTVPGDIAALLSQFGPNGEEALRVLVMEGVRNARNAGGGGEEEGEDEE